jgi:hypothetical protein
MDPVATKAALSQACSTLEQALQICAGLEQEKAALNKQVVELQTKLAQQDKVVLEKVAAAKAATRLELDPVTITETLAKLVDLSLLPPGESEKLASHLRQDPNSALRLVQRVATLSVPSHSEGRAVEKSASHFASTSDPDGWGKVITQGAA